MQQKSRAIRKRALQTLDHLSPKKKRKMDKFTEAENCPTTDELVNYQLKSDSLQKQLDIYKKKHTSLKICYKKVKNENKTIHKGLSKILTKSQINHLIKKRKGQHGQQKI